PLFDSLQRPVQITETDLNNDSKPDYLICEFGYITGSLSWMENVGNKKFVRHVLRPLPGAIKAYITDLNHDGLPDILALFAQGDESVILFTNKGKGEFSQEQVLRFPPSYGSSYFELDDFNNDGYPDILYTCGDNADFSPVLKPYHGVYIFINDKTNHFTQKYFFPIHGCYKAMAMDFDGDGDLDIAAISFFADYTHQPEEGFVYLKNTGNLNFLPFTLPGTEIGRWLTMDAGDMDGDGKIDIVLGNFSIGPVINKPAENWKKSPPFIILKNLGQ
ncbi:MAG: VCBS repeat-containing protein, partial [Bacteroidota bacterium]|nr:VCBS repeat-containing protein [Bacteroidota bacterium]